MELNSKRLEKTSKLLYWIISIILCGFLILLGNRILWNLDQAFTAPQMQDTVSEKALAPILAEQVDLAVDKSKLEKELQTLDSTIAAANQNYNNEKQSFDNWLETRKVLGLSKDDAEVKSRVAKLDNFYKIEQEWIAQRTKLNTSIGQIDEASALLDNQRLLITNDANERYVQAKNWFDIKVFLWRLLIVSPILLLGLWFLLKRRHDAFWPLYRGFVLFAFYAFFVGLAPYLPSYGGYVRYGMGIVLSVVLGYYAIKNIQLFLAKQKEQLQVSQMERAQNIQLEAAEKALNQHYCPSCGKDFLPNNWEVNTNPALANRMPSAYRLVSDYCRHCGLNLFANCSQCDTKNYVHLPFCMSCGHHVKPVSANSPHKKEKLKEALD